jgi:hypothetical protein
MLARMVRAFSAASALVLAMPLAYADCAGPERNPTPAEQDFYDRATAALIALLPPPPVGARVDEKYPDNVELMGIYCAEHKIGGFTIQVRRQYVAPVDQAALSRWEQERKALSAQMHEVSRTPPEKRAEWDRVYSLGHVKQREADAARKAGDKATETQRRAEADAYFKESAALEKQHRDSYKPQYDELQKRAWQMDKEQPKEPTGGVVYFINRRTIPTKSENGIAGGFGADSKDRSASLRVVNVAFAAGGTSGALRDALIEALPRERLQALVGKPLPSVEQSRAQAPLPATKLPPSAVAAAPAPPAAATPAQPVVAATSPAPSPTAGTTGTTGAPAAAAATSKPQAASAPATSTANKIDTAGKAIDTVNRLRGLLGR